MSQPNQSELLKPRPTQVCFLLDESGSMSDFTKAVREAVGSIIETNLDPGTRFCVITFSGGVDAATDMAQLKRPEHGATHIAPAFKRMHAVVNGIPGKRAPERVIIVFISDGEDDAPAKCVSDLRALPAFPFDSILLTVGIGGRFPTELVVDVLRPKYHRGSLALPPVLPVKNLPDLSWAFGQLEAVLLTELMQCAPIPSKVDDTTSTRVLIQFIRAKYNECAVKCAESGRRPRDNLAILNETTAKMHQVALLAKARVVQDRAALKARAAAGGESEGDAGENEGNAGENEGAEDATVEIAEASDGPRRIKPLLSNLISATVYNPKTCLTLALSVVRRLNEMIAAASKGQLISDLPDDAKQELIGYAYTEGRLMHVASRYRAANFSTTKQSLLRLLRSYSPKDSDKSLPDPINLADQAEYFADARDNLLDLIPFTHTLNGIVKVLPFVGRTLTFKTPMPIDALQMNEWLAEVVALPMVHRYMTTYDFYTTFNEAFSARGEKVNGLMILGGDPNSPGIFHHLQSMILLKHPGLFVLTARLAVAGSVLAFILGNHSTHEGWMDQELDMVRGVCANYPQTSLADWQFYMEDMRSNQRHTRCLVPESPKLPRHCKCQGLTKYLLALYLTIANGHVYTMEELNIRHMALVTEFLSRCRVQFFDFFDNAAYISPQTLLEKVWEASDGSGGVFGEDEILYACPTYASAREKFASKVDEFLTSKVRGKILVGTTFQANRLYALSHYQLSLHRIGTFFSHLANMCVKDRDSAPEFILPKPQLIRAMHTAQTIRTAYERSTSPPSMDPIPRDELQNILSSHFTGKHRSAVMGRMDAFVKTRFEAYHQLTHSGLARPIPSEYIQRFKEEFGLDIGADWGVGPSGLSTLACCSPDCPHFLELMEMPRKRTARQAQKDSDPKDSAQKDSDQKDASPKDSTPKESGIHQDPILCRKLRLHLSQGAPSIAGFHKTVLAFQNLAPEHVAAKIASGECLLESLPSRQVQLPTRDDMLQRSAVTDHCAGVWSQSARKLEELRIAQARARRDGILSGLQQAVSELGSGDPSFLSRAVGELQGQLESPTWCYDDFRAIFAKQYKKHPELTPDRHGVPEPVPAGLCDAQENSEPVGHA